MQSFSIVLETENLAKGEVTDLDACLASLDAQALDVRRANEVLLVDCGQVAAPTLEALRAKYPWIRVHIAPELLHYYEVKMLGAGLVTGEVLVLADSDLVYDPGWLQAHVAAFDDPGIAFTSGETRIAIRGPYTFSLATTLFFPIRYRGATAPSLIGNNAAARRTALLARPFPYSLPLYRAQSALHGASLRDHRLSIAQVAARGTHAPLESPGAWALRYAISGADSVAAACYDVTPDGGFVYRGSIGRRLRSFGRVLVRKIGSSVVRSVDACVEAPTRIVYLPIALVISAGALLLFTAGAVTSMVGSRAVSRWIRAFETARVDPVEALRAS